MRRQLRIFITAQVILSVTTACSHQSWTKTEELTRVSSMFNSVLLPVNLLAKAGKMATAPDDQQAGTPRREKQFVLSEKVMADFSSDSARMAGILSIKESVRQEKTAIPAPGQADRVPEADWKQKTGRYPLGDSFVIVSDSGDEYRVRYEDEHE